MLFRSSKNGQAIARAVPPPEAAPPAAPANVSATPSAETKPHFTLGVVVETGEPFRFPKKLLGHAHIRGMTRSGKTSLTLIALIYQLLDEDEEDST